MMNLKTDYEIGLMERAGRLLAAVVKEMCAAVKPGLTTGDLDQLADRLIRAGGARPGFLGYQDYPKSTCISVNDEVVHGIPGKRSLRQGDIVSLDLGLVLDGFWADMGCTVPVGNISPEAARLVRVTEESFWVGIEQAVPGGRLGDISAAIQRHVESHGYSVVRQFVGHGIGRNMHEDPQVPNFGTPGTGPALKAGMVLAIEPMVNAGGFDVHIKPDGWTVCTADGSLSSYYENTVAITAQGPRVLTLGDREPGFLKAKRAGQ